MSWTVTVEPVPADAPQACQGELGRMAAGTGRCANPAAYRLTAGTLASHACGQHLRAELEAVGRMTARMTQAEQS